MSRAPQFKFRLYIAAGTENALRAVTNLTALCREHLPDRHDIEIVDVLREPSRALVDGIFMTPTLVRLAPRPTQQIIGTLSQKDEVLATLGLQAAAA